MAGRWNGTNGSGWSFNSKRYSSYISDEEVYDLIQNYDKTSIDLFSDVEQVKLATFILNYHKEEMNHANEQEAFELVEKWEERIKSTWEKTCLDYAQTYKLVRKWACRSIENAENSILSDMFDSSHLHQ